MSTTAPNYNPDLLTLRIWCLLGHRWEPWRIRYDPWPDAETWVACSVCSCGALKDKRHIGGMGSVPVPLREEGLSQMKRTMYANL